MKKLTTLILLFAAACAQINPAPGASPTPPATIIVDFPYTAEPGFVPFPQPITSEDMAEAESFLLILKTNAAAGNASGIAERVAYPIDVTVMGQKVTLNSPEEFVQNYDQIFNDTVLLILSEADEGDLISGPEGVRAANGELWFNLFCMDAACSEKAFLITQINN